MAVLTICDVPEGAHVALVAEASEQGQTLQEFLLAVVKQEVALNRNRQIVDEIERELAAGDNADVDGELNS